MSPGAVERVVGLLSAMAGGGAEAGDLSFTEPTVRVWVEDPRHAPGGRPTHRGPAGHHYYDVPPGEMGSGAEPDSFVALGAHGPGDPETVHPLGLTADKAWQPYRGPMGGEGWINTETQNIRYDKKYPGLEDDLPGMPNDAVRDAKRAVDGADPEDVAEVVAGELDMDVQEAVDASTTSTSDGPDPWRLANLAAASITNEEMGEEGSDHERVERLMGRLAALDDDGDGGAAAATAKAWVPYSGPQGGSGWQNADTGEVVYQDNPPGEFADPSDMTTDELGEALAAVVGEEEAVETFREADGRGDVEDRLTNTLESRYGPVREVDVEDPPLGISQYDVDWGLVVGSSYVYDSGSDGYPALEKGQRDAFDQQLRREHGSQAVNNMESLRDSWKTTSYSDRAQAREKAFMEAAGVDGEPRNHELHSDDPITDEMVAAARDISQASEHFVEQHYADENGDVEVHRGLGDRMGDKVKIQAFSDFAEGTSRDAYEFEFNPMTNYSVDRSVAASWGRNTATITQDRYYKDTMAATDLVMEDGQEGEVSMEGGPTEVPVEGIAVSDEWSPGDLAADDPDTDTLVAAMETADAMVDDINRKRDWPDEALDGIVSVAEEVKERAPDDSEDREAAKDAVADALERGDGPVYKVAQDAVNEAIGEEEASPRGLTKGLFGGASAEEYADGLVDNLTEVHPEHSDALLEELAGMTFDIEEGGELRVKADDVAERARTWSDEDEKADPTPDDPYFEADEDPDTVDWIARSREEREDPETGKAWVPYRGPQGGEGWRETESGEVHYGPEPPGPRLTSDDLSDDEIEYLADQAGLSPEEVRDRLGGEPADAEPEEEPAPWTGEEHPDPAEPSVDEYAEAISEHFNDRVGEEAVEDFREELDRAEGPDGSSDIEPGVLLEEMFNRRTAQRIEKTAKREARFSDNSAPDHLDPTNAEEIHDLADTKAETGITAEAMDVAVMPDGSLTYVTHVSEDTPEGVAHQSASAVEDAEAAVAGASALEAMGVEVPDHHYEHNRFYSVEGVDGPSVDENKFDFDNEKTVDDEREAYRTMAAQVLIGNRDPHAGNVAIEDGRLVPFDLDMSGHDSTRWDDSYSGFQKAARTLEAAGVEEHESNSGRVRELKWTAEELANEIDEGEVLEQIPDPDLRETIEDNIDHWRQQ